MDNTINQFCKKYFEKLKNDKDIEEVKLDYLYDYRERIGFYVTEYTFTPHCYYTGINTGNRLFVLDDEDLKYLHDKYSKRLQDEMNKNLEQIRQMYIETPIKL